MDINELKALLADLSERAQAIQNKADTDGRALSDEESGELDGIFSEFEATEGEIKRREKILNVADRAGASAGRRVQPVAAQPAAQDAGATPRDGLRHTVLPTAQERGRNGFGYFGEFVQAVRVAQVQQRIDPRLVRNAASTWGGEAAGEDGGFAVPPDFRRDIVELVGGEDGLLGRTDQQTTTGNQLVVPVDENAPWHTAGVRMYWTDEADDTTQTKPKIRPVTVRANKLMGLVYLTDELLQDAVSMGNYVQSRAGPSMEWSVNDAIVNGSGAGKPMGIMNSPALVTVSKESSQPAATLLGANIMKMWGRMPPRSRANAVWLINQDAEVQLMQMNIPVKNVAGSENVGGWPVYMPPGGLSAAPYGTLLGRPVIATEACSALGTTGDIILADMRGYLSVVKSGGVRTDISIHVEFEKDLTAFRFIMRMGGQPWLSAPIGRKNGSNTLSHFVALETRA